MAIAAKFRGKPGEYLGGIPDTDLDEAQFSALSDEQKATVAASNLYELRGDAPAEAAKAERRVERAEVTPPVPAATSQPSPAAHPKDDGK